MNNGETGKVVLGDAEAIRRSSARFLEQPVDMVYPDDGATPYSPTLTTTARQTSVTGPGTFFGKAQRTLTFEPSTAPGWAFRRDDVAEAMPIGVSVNNVWTTVRNIVLCSGSPHNYMRMVEHIVALRLGLGLDNLTIRVDSGDPPLFDRGSMDLVEALENAGIVSTNRPAAYLTVKEPVSFGGGAGSFLTFLPAENDDRRLHFDCAIDFKTALGKQRIKFTLNRATFRHGALARTNAPLWMMLYSKTIGQIFADVRHLGYTTKNILIAGYLGYFNKPGLIHNGKSLEAVWHRATLDLLAAIALIDRGRLAGTVLSYKAGHTLDAQAVRSLYDHDLLREI